MARTLNVFYAGELAGRLVQDNGGKMNFEYAPSWLSRPSPIALSRSLPLREDPFTQRECEGFFGGILPEAETRKILARILGISPRNDFALLEQIGGEVAGALTFLPDHESMPAEDHHYHELADDELAKVLRELPRRPLMAGEAGVRLSLAGAQDKIAICLHDETVSVPLGNAPSTHVLKPAVDTYAGVVFNEAFCMSLARACGLEAADVQVGDVDGIDYLLIQRYDRVTEIGGSISRLHQEDFCQALGVRSDRKYQSEGGPSLADCFALVRDASSVPAVDLIALLDAVLFNLLIGNHDAHAKNFSLLYGADGATRLAPLYDLLSTVFYTELTSSMAMRLGKQKKSALVYPRDIERFAAECGLSPAQTRVRLVSMADRLLQEIPTIDRSHPVAESVAELITARCQTSLSRFRRS